MNRYFVYLSYNGKNYSGWQVQPNAPTVQQTIERALYTILRVDTPIVGAGRTDAGVHAREMVAHFDSNKDPLFIQEELSERLNRVLPKDIVISQICLVAKESHARFDALWRQYKYYITVKKDPFLYDFRWYCKGGLDMDAMNNGANILFDYDDFTSFSKLHTDVKTNLCRIMSARWDSVDAHTWVFTIRADRFLRNMVRAVVGTLLEMGRGRLDEKGFRRIIEMKNRCLAGTSVPAHALFLDKVAYPDHIFVTS